MRRWRRRASGGVSNALVAATAGAGLGWFLDPRAGRARRAELLGRVARGLRAAQEWFPVAGAGAAHVGGSHPEPEVVEVKSPAELEPGVAHASPEPTFENRVDRGRHDRGGSAAPKRRRRTRGAASSDTAGAPAGSADVTTDPAYLAPDVGAGVREGDLGSVAGPDAERDAGEAGDEGTARREPDDDGP